MIFDATLNLTKGSMDDSYSPMIRFTSVKSDGSPSPDGHYVAMGSDVELGYPELYEGGTVTGKVATLVPVDEPSGTIKMNVDWNLDAFYGMPQ